MAQKRTIYCDIEGCNTKFEEVEANLGFPGWGHVGGITLNGSPNPSLCPLHLTVIAKFADDIGDKT